MVIGTQALEAYEFAAEVFIETPKTSPGWVEAGSRLTLAAPAMVPPDELLALLRRGDRSFQLLPGPGLVAATKTGFKVSFVSPPPVRAPHRIRGRDAQGVMVPAESGDLAALVNSPRFSQVVIGRRGDPVTMEVPDPRALALHKLWLSQQEGPGARTQARDRVPGRGPGSLDPALSAPVLFFLDPTASLSGRGGGPGRGVGGRVRGG